jgi:hypothetical protein
MMSFFPRIAMRGRLVFAEVLLKLGGKSDVVGIISKETDLLRCQHETSFLECERIELGYRHFQGVASMNYQGAML